MKCINKKYYQRFYRLIALCLAVVTLYGCQAEEIEVASYETSSYNAGLYRGELFTDNLCVSSADTETENSAITAVKSAGLFDLNNNRVIYAEGIFNQVFPASTTKIMTALVALENGNLDDIVTVSDNADSASFAADESTCGLLAGDQVTLRDLLYALTLNSGNDAAVAIAEHVGGSVEDFCELMNQKAASIMATHTHFTNPHGLHDDDHYTTAYDLYLIFNAAIAHEEYVAILKTGSYDMPINGTDGLARTIKCEPTNQYSLGETTQPTAASVLGGKTGTTIQAGYCLVAYDEDSSQNPYISIIMGADTRPLLYTNMTSLIEIIGSD